MLNKDSNINNNKLVPIIAEWLQRIWIITGSRRFESYSGQLL